jgi:hypothetical protein
MARGLRPYVLGKRWTKNPSVNSGPIILAAEDEKDSGIARKGPREDSVTTTVGIGSQNATFLARRLSFSRIIEMPGDQRLVPVIELVPKWVLCLHDRTRTKVGRHGHKSILARSDLLLADWSSRKYVR